MSLIKTTTTLIIFCLFITSLAYTKTAEDYFNSGYAKAELKKDYRGEIQDYTKAIELNPKDAEAYYNRGTAKAELKDYKGARQDYTKAIKLNPKDFEAYTNRGVAKFELKKDYRGAIQDYTKAIELNPKDAEAYYNRGLTKITSGQKDSGCLDLSKAGELGLAGAYEAIKKYCN